MGCGCNKNKDALCVGEHCKNKSILPGITSESVVSLKEITIIEEHTTTMKEFKERKIDDSSSLSKKIEMGKSFISSIASRGIQNNKVSIPLKQLRVLGCFGNKPQGGELPPCEFLRKSKTAGKFFCGGCGCGDKAMTWLMGDGEEYSKLDHPKLACPLQMPGFTNYKESGPEEAISPITRRYYIENMQYDDVEKVQVSLPDPSFAPPIPPTP